LRWRTVSNISTIVEYFPPPLRSLWPAGHTRIPFLFELHTYRDSYQASDIGLIQTLRGNAVVEIHPMDERILSAYEDAGVVNLKNGVTRQQHGRSAVEPDAGVVDAPMDLIDTVFTVLGIETGDHLFEDDLSDGKKRSDQPWILAIDDDDDIALALRLRLREYGAQVIRAAEGMEGYRRAFTDLPRAIILDYELPQCNGDYVLRRLKESPVTCDIPVIVLTGRRETDIERQMWELGASEYLTKPLNWNRLRAALEVFLDVDRGTGAAKQSPTETSLPRVARPNVASPQ
jgi:CheY-like chemotaxis protein